MLGTQKRMAGLEGGGGRAVGMTPRFFQKHPYGHALIIYCCVTNDPEPSRIKQPFHCAHRFCRSGIWMGIGRTMSRTSAKKNIEGLELSRNFRTPTAGAQAKMTRRLASAGTVNKSTLVWPPWVTYVSHSMTAARRDVTSEGCPESTPSERAT